MIDVSRLYEWLIETKSTITEINLVDVVLDESELANVVGGVAPKDNYITVGIIPEFDTSPTTNEDAIKHNNYLMFMVLKKLDYSGFKNRDERIQFWNDSQQIMKKLEAALISSKTDGDDICPEFRDLDLTSIHIEPVWKFVQCNGWLMTLTIKT